MRLLVPALIGRGVVEPEIGAEVDEGDVAGDDLGRDALRMAVGQSGEHEVHPIEQGRLETLDRQIALTYLSTHPQKGFYRLKITPSRPDVEVNYPSGYSRN